MRTLLSHFCESFDEIVRPVIEPLAGSAQALGEASAELPGREVRAELLELRHQIEVLVNKVAEQQAYVLIFGPLKSGKSTLMNALASTYVSEVSSLPAYPCMVYLSHSDERQFDITRYNGKRERFTDPTALYVHINRAHGELAERIRETEERGGTFDPAMHFPEAIRKIDVRIPAGDLHNSGAVLVDTPGLYSRMKFGYDRMTREFRDSASCAIFIVKSDNLFLEQVFAEFEDLLDLGTYDRSRSSQDLKGEGYVLGDRLVLQELVVLKNGADRSTQIRDLPSGQRGDVLAGNPDLAASDRLVAKYQTNESRLARPGRTDQKDELSLLYLQRDVVGGNGATLIDFGYVFEKDHGDKGSLPARRVRMRYQGRYR